MTSSGYSITNVFVAGHVSKCVCACVHFGGGAERLSHCIQLPIACFNNKQAEKNLYCYQCKHTDTTKIMKYQLSISTQSNFGAVLLQKSSQLSQIKTLRQAKIVRLLTPRVFLRSRSALRPSVSPLGLGRIS